MYSHIEYSCCCFSCILSLHTRHTSLLPTSQLLTGHEPKPLCSIWIHLCYEHYLSLLTQTTLTLRPPTGVLQGVSPLPHTRNSLATAPAQRTPPSTSHASCVEEIASTHSSMPACFAAFRRRTSHLKHRESPPTTFTENHPPPTAAFSHRSPLYNRLTASPPASRTMRTTTGAPGPTSPMARTWQSSGDPSS